MALVTTLENVHEDCGCKCVEGLVTLCQYHADLLNFFVGIKSRLNRLGAARELCAQLGITL